MVQTWSNSGATWCLSSPVATSNFSCGSVLPTGLQDNTVGSAHLIVPTALAFLANSEGMEASSSHSRTRVSRAPAPAGMPPAGFQNGIVQHCPLNMIPGFHIEEGALESPHIPSNNPPLPQQKNCMKPWIHKYSH